MSNIKFWSTAAASNNASPPDGAPEGWAPADVNNTIREGMGAVRRWYEDAQWTDFDHSVSQVSATSFKVVGDVTSLYTAGRRLRPDDAGSFLYGDVATATYAAPDTLVTVNLDSGALTSSMTGVALGIITPTNGAVPALLTAADLFLTGDLSVSGIAVAGGITLGGDPIPSGTEMLFAQVAAPTGWTQTVATDDAFLRIVSGAGGGTGGAWTITGLTASAIALSIDQLPAHSHGAGNLITQGLGAHNHGSGIQLAGSGFGTGPYANVGSVNGTDIVTGQDASSHSHTIAGSTGVGGGAGSVHGHAVKSDAAWRPAYRDAILATKD